jgi:hypothetical protein
MPSRPFLPHTQQSSSSFSILSHLLLHAADAVHPSFLQPLPPLFSYLHGLPPRTPPLLRRIKPHQPLRAHIIPIPHQIRNVHVQRTARVRIRQQLLHSRERGRKRVRGRPVRGRQKSKADFACLEVDVWVDDGGAEADEGWCEGVVGRDGDG